MKTVTRTCNGRNTFVSRARHVRVTLVTRTCYAFSVEEFWILFASDKPFHSVCIENAG